MKTLITASLLCFLSSNALAITVNVLDRKPASSKPSVPTPTKITTTTFQPAKIK